MLGFREKSKGSPCPSCLLALLEFSITVYQGSRGLKSRSCIFITSYFVGCQSGGLGPGPRAAGSRVFLIVQESKMGRKGTGRRREGLQVWVGRRSSGSAWQFRAGLGLSRPHPSYGTLHITSCHFTLHFCSWKMVHSVFTYFLV